MYSKIIKKMKKDKELSGLNKGSMEFTLKSLGPKTQGKKEMESEEESEDSEKEDYEMPEKEGKLPAASGTVEMGKSEKARAEDMVLAEALLKSSKKKKKG